MALINCAECSGEVSTDAKFCPHCGAKAKSFKRRPMTVLETILFAASVILVLMYVSFDSDSKNESILSQNNSISPTYVTLASTTYAPTDILDLMGGRISVLDVCQASIATIMRRPIETTLAVATDSYVHVSYTRESDGSMWDYKCNVVDDKVVWGAADGRWRTLSEDGVVRFNIKANELVITEEVDGYTVSEGSYSLSQTGLN